MNLQDAEVIINLLHKVNELEQRVAQLENPEQSTTRKAH
jgi:hypothetical protein